MSLKFPRAASLFLAAASTLVAVPDPPVIPEPLDFTKGETLPEKTSHDWTLGPIGARGWCHVSSHGSEGETSDSRQILITRIDPKGAASKLLKQGDVVLGIGPDRFNADARIAFAQAIGEAEASDSGELSLLVYQDGGEKKVTISLKKFAAFSVTAPYNCEKSAQILKEGCDALAKRGLGRPAIDTHINGLALLATGDRSYRKAIEELAEATVKRPLSEEMGLACWSFAFANIFLCEYHLATGDKSVLPEIRRLSGHLVKGQGPVGTWGHTFADYETDRLRGYGAVNAVGLPVAISLVLARECRQDFEGLDEAITQSATFFRRHVGIGAIPYGDGPPNLQYGHDDNGKNSVAAIFFSLLDDAPATRYYTQTALAAHGLDREQGHTGNFWNMLWAMPAVSLAGPQASGAWMDQFGWYYDLARDADYRFPYQGYPRQRDKNAYSAWDCPGAYLFHFAAPLKKLRILGKGVTCKPKFTVAEIQNTLEAGSISYRYASQEFLQENLSSWSPVVRHYSAKELRRRKAPLASKASLTSRSSLDRIAALRASKNFTACAKLLKDPDLRVRMAAVSVMAGKDKARAVGEVFKHLAANPKEAPVFTQHIGNVFFPLGVSGNAVGKLLNAPKDRKTTIAAILRLLDDEDALVSSRVAMGLSSLPDKELFPLLPVIYERSMNPPSGNVMFANKLRTASAEVLVKLQLQEGLDVATTLLADMSWGKNGRLPQAAALTLKYGGHAKGSLEPVKLAFSKMNPNGDHQWKALIKETIEKIEASDDPKGKLKTIQAIR
ncbi:DUF6288 domain-containing protein [Akkermansiaceae bacterium]|nr:DUF6288 domain-containing protein [Akkermansiaceae bacterium]